jgi:hypothetical protein
VRRMVHGEAKPVKSVQMDVFESAAEPFHPVFREITSRVRGFSVDQNPRPWALAGI